MVAKKLEDMHKKMIYGQKKGHRAQGAPPLRGMCPLCPVGRTQLPLSHKWTSSDPTQRYRQVYDWGNLNGQGRYFDLCCKEDSLGAI